MDCYIKSLFIPNAYIDLDLCHFVCIHKGSLLPLTLFNSLWFMWVLYNHTKLHQLEAIIQALGEIIEVQQGHPMNYNKFV